MAAIAACRRGGQLGAHSIALNGLRGFVPWKTPSSFEGVASSASVAFFRRNSQLVKSNGKRLFLIDTLAINELIQEAKLSKFKTEVQSSQGNHFSLLQHETDKVRNDIEKMRSELRYEIDKVTAGQRLDLNLERGRIREELSNQGAETSNLTNKLDREIHALRAQLEAAKYAVIKYCIGTVVSISAVGLAVVRILM
ncbi:protein FMP32, mitochondrial-like isoform X2 [Prosopis cineraria]|uniref:protein FMP32, mitochondrial-like isoform X2 n=1 Tax=Prosopis cineraria TaxID=364024 RepID=UPI0024108C43|nr:protein FMP32, mitochondrial-like isoform X2 [Prosopis cineraria]